MNLRIASLALCLLLQEVVAAPRGAAHKATNGLRERKAMEEKNKENMNAVGEDRTGLQEVHACEPDGTVAIDYVNSFGMPEAGDEGCLADPVNGCSGGCCRFSVYFMCDTDNTDPYAPCVCNDLTADPVVINTEQSLATGNATAGDALPEEEEPPLTASILANEFPNILAAIEAQEGAIAAEEDEDEEEEKADKNRVRKYSLLCCMISACTVCHSNTYFCARFSGFV